MEKWINRFSDVIPYDAYDYFVNIRSGEEAGLVVELEYKKDSTKKVIIDFGSTEAMRIVEEGLYLTGVFRDEEIGKYKEKKFESVIYEIEDGEFGNFIKNTSAGLYDHFQLKHFIIVTANFVIEVINSTDPEIIVLKK
ncbi:hypothetical protein A5821_000262 [Enterococcus sp. 7F3_DIV0205]|uniref:Uncharacterized protein n=1 Tax=Candidatus Enterococcus palustris TaxID=1834189 RepID=A0A242AVN4_9ENTE|nr:hypothetical protein [Enterococcus sp. 7F3_DIV0205]OTN84668.1 hypothetical protein A5821_000597 [Enterococcus sp. 7F3_DIV0205]OTN84675.1 hypothetical protein A5821_000604 [Enterococcus sp. 7F3_DIV0205]